jgi:capsular exopolysaccharide synthesis family protein
LRQKLEITDEDPNANEPTPTLDAKSLSLISELEVNAEHTYNEQKKELEKLRTIQTNNFGMLSDVLPGIAPDATLSDLVSRYHEARQKFVTLTNDYALTTPDVGRVQSLLVELTNSISQRVVGIMESLQAQVEAKKADIDDLSNKVVNARIQDQAKALTNQPYYDARRELSQKLEMRQVLYAKLQNEKVNSALPANSMVQITDPAVPGKAPVKPNKALNIVLGLIFGLVMGVGLAFFIEYLDTSVKTIDDVERTFQAPVLGVIPQNIGYLLEEGTESKHAEAYRVLRTNLLFSRKNDKMNTIVVVSAGAGEGKSTTTINLATVFAQAGNRVLIVDSDLRRPTLHKLFKVTNNLGLTNYLLKQNTIPELIQTTQVPNLDFMASGRLPNSSMGILGSAQMKEMIADLRQRYDFILFDSPPILGVSDASVLASEVDLVMQVIQYRRYPQPMTIRAKQMIEKVGGNFVGLVLNNINMSQDEGYYYYSGYYHDYYYSRSASEQDAEANAEKAGKAAADGAAPEKKSETNIKQKY